MKKILMVVYSHFPRDTRVRRESDALVRNGYKVDVICLRSRNEKKYENYNSINIYRLNIDIFQKYKK